MIVSFQQSVNSADTKLDKDEYLNWLKENFALQCPGVIVKHVDFDGVGHGFSDGQPSAEDWYFNIDLEGEEQTLRNFLKQEYDFTDEYLDALVEDASF